MRKITLIAVVFIAFIIPINSVSANFQNALDWSNVDGLKDSEYEKIFENANFTINFMNSNSSYYFFIESSDLITEIQIDTFLFYENVESANYKTSFQSNKSEIAINLNYDTMTDKSVIIRINFLTPIKLNLSPIFPEEPEKPKETKEIWYKFTWIFSVIMCFLTLLIIRFWILNKKPHVYAREKNKYNLKYLGRFIDSIYDEKIRKYRMYFKRTDGIFEYYSDLGWNDLEKYGLNVDSVLVSSVSAFHMLLPHIVIDEIKIDAEIGIKKHEFDKKSRTYKFYKFLCFLPLKSFVYQIFKKSFKETDENIEKIDVLTLEYSRDCIEYLFNIKFKTKAIDEDTGKEKWIVKEESKVNYTRILTLKESGIKDLKIEFFDAEIYEFHSLNEAILNRDSKEELKSKFLLKEMKLNHNIKKLAGENFEYIHQIQDLKSSLKQQVIESIQKFVEKSDSLNENIPGLLGKVFANNKWGIKDKENYQQALSEILESTDKAKNTTEIKELESRLKELNEKCVNLEKSIKDKNLLGVEL